MFDQQPCGYTHRPTDDCVACEMMAQHALTRLEYEALLTMVERGMAFEQALAIVQTERAYTHGSVVE